MRLYFFSFALLALPSPVDAAEIKSARFEPRTNAIEVEYSLIGGCRTHNVLLKLGECKGSSPVNCEARLVDLMQVDFCEAVVSGKATYPLLQYGLMDPYFSGGTIRIQGDNKSEISVTLPKF